MGAVKMMMFSNHRKIPLNPPFAKGEVVIYRPPKD